MAKTDDIWATFAAATGLPFNEVKGLGRAVREMGLFPKFHKHDKEQHVPDMALAHLTVAVMLQLPVAATPHGVAAMADAVVDEESRRDLAELADDLRQLDLAPLLERDHTFTEAVAQLYRIARAQPYVFNARFESLTSVEVERRSLEGRINLHTMPVFGADRPVGEIIVYAPAVPHSGGALEVTARLPASVISAVARVADRMQT